MKTNAEIADALIESARLNIGSPDAELLREAASRLRAAEHEPAPSEEDFETGSAIETIGL